MQVSKQIRELTERQLMDFEQLSCNAYYEYIISKKTLELIQAEITVYGIILVKIDNAYKFGKALNDFIARINTIIDSSKEGCISINMAGKMDIIETIAYDLIEIEGGIIQ